MFYAPKHFYNDGESRGYLPWQTEKIYKKQIKGFKADPKRDYIDVTAPTDIGRSNMRQVIDATLAASGLTARDLVGPSRFRNIMLVRHASWAVARKWTTASTTQIGKLWHRDHSTVVSGLQRVAKQPHVYAGIIAAIERELVKQK